MTSDQPQRYIDREGINEQETAEIIKSDDLTILKKENQELKETMSMILANQDEIVKSLGRSKK